MTFTAYSGQPAGGEDCHTMSGYLIMGHSRITSLANPNRTQDTATKIYVDGDGNLRMAKIGDTMSGVLAMSGSKITDLANPTSSQDTITKTMWMVRVTYGC